MAEVEELIGKGESETVEFKERFENEAVETEMFLKQNRVSMII